MLKEKIGKILNKFSGSVLYRTVCILLLLTMITAWSVTGVYAKYVSSSSISQTSQVASMGVIKFELSEHKPVIDIKYMVENNALHGLSKDEVIMGSCSTYYTDVPPGVDIPKDIAVRMVLASEVNYELYVEIKKSENFPTTVTFKLADGWEKVEGQENLYRYTKVFQAGKTYGTSAENYVVEILEDNKLIVSDKYTGKTASTNGSYTGGSFGLEFVAFLKQSQKEASQP